MTTSEYFDRLYLLIEEDAMKDGVRDNDIRILAVRYAKYIVALKEGDEESAEYRLKWLKESEKITGIEINYLNDVN